MIGGRVPRPDATNLVTGAARYAADAEIKGMLYARVLRSEYPHALIRRVDTTEAERLPGVRAVITAADAAKRRVGLVIKDQPLLAGDRVRYVGDAIAAVAAEDEIAAEAALEAIRVEYEPLPAVFDVFEALADGAPVLHEHKDRYEYSPGARDWFISRRPGNLCGSSRIVQGDADSGFRASDVIVADTFRTQRQEHVSLEPHAAITSFDGAGRLTVWCSTAKPFRLLGMLSSALDIPIGKLNVVQTYTGGDFGGKGDLSIEPLCALLTLKTGRPVKLVMSREEEFRASTCRMPATIEARLGATRAGALQALSIRMTSNAGPYAGFCPLISAWAVIHGSGPYNIPHIELEGRVVYTNALMAGAFRGFGNPQITFARESLLDRLAKELDLEPTELRLRNAWDYGSTTATGQRLSPDKHGIGFKKTLVGARDAAGLHPAKESQPAPGKRRGRGVASMFHGVGVAAFLGGADPSSCVVKLNQDGTFTLMTGFAECGQGGRLTLRQIAGEELGVPAGSITVGGIVETDTAPYDRGSGASGSIYITGNAVRRASAAVRNQLIAAAAGEFEASPEDIEIQSGRIQVRGVPHRGRALAEFAKDAFYRIGLAATAAGSFADYADGLDPKGQGQVFSAFSYGTQIADVEVDLETGEVRVLKLVAAQDVGKAINPMIVEGQMEGALVTGIGLALCEELVVTDGMPANPNLAEYKVPTAADVPPLVCVIVEEPEPTGPFGAKGAGEAGLVATAAAIGNAVYDALGVPMNDLPIRPEKILARLGVLHG